MYDIVINWLNIHDIYVSDDIVYVTVVIFSIFVLNFLFDIIRYIMYYISRR